MSIDLDNDLFDKTAELVGRLNKYVDNADNSRDRHNLCKLSNHFGGLHDSCLELQVEVARLQTFITESKGNVTE